MTLEPTATRTTDSTLLLKFEVTSADAREWFHWSARMLPGAKRMAIAERVLVVLVTGPQAIRWFLKGGVGILVGVLMLVIMVAVAWAFPRMSAWFRAENVLNRLRDTNLGLGHSTMAFDANGLTYGYPGGEDYHPWADVVRLAENGPTLYLLITETHALVIPPSAFATDEQRRAAIALVRSRIDRAQSERAHTPRLDTSGRPDS